MVLDVHTIMWLIFCARTPNTKFILLVPGIRLGALLIVLIVPETQAI
jgi:hypothetical protein